MAAGTPSRRNKSSKGSANGGPTPNRKLKGREKTPPKRAVEKEAEKADAIIHDTVVERFREPAYASNTRHEWTDVQLAAARLYGRGFTRAQIARGLVDHLSSKEYVDGKGYKRTAEKRLVNARQTLRRWEAEQWFRDKIFDLAVIKTDLEIPQIMEGVVRKAKRGRVDAAKLALQMAGRMSTEETGGGNVTVVFGANIPRPEGRGTVEPEEIEDAEYEELE